MSAHIPAEPIALSDGLVVSVDRHGDIAVHDVRGQQLRCLRLTPAEWLALIPPYSAPRGRR